MIDCWRPAREALQKRLAMYRLRAKVEIAPRDDLAVVAAWGGAEIPASFLADPRLAAMGHRAILANSAVALDAAAYTSRRLDLGVPEGGDFGQDRMFALDAGLDELHGVAFDKGCYVGQELTARMKHRGTARKRLLVIEAAGGNTLPANDTSVTANGRELGSIASAYGTRGFALIRLDRLEEAANAPIEAGGVPVILAKPAWLFA